jgi:two-component system, chemotaxis family, protein-glutamate methylesterase/glutaminase
MKPTTPLKVLIVDDAVVFRQGLTEILADVPYVDVVGVAANGKIALMKIPSLNPDALILDVEMPEMDGIETLHALREQYPHIKVIMFSIHTTRGAKKTMEALSLGAIDFVPKPKSAAAYQIQFSKIREDLLPKLYLLSLQTSTARPRPPAKPDRVQPLRPPLIRQRCDIIAIASSTGGPNALTTLLPKLAHSVNVGILIVQHMPPLFTKQFAISLDQKTEYTVREAITGDSVEPDAILIAPGNYHMIVKPASQGNRVALHQGPLENGCRPSADVLFRSVAEVYGKRALCIVLTGMGKDGMEGSRAMKAQGSTILAQDRESSVAWGMPRSVIEAELADSVLPLDEIASTVNQIIS